MMRDKWPSVTEKQQGREDREVRFNIFVLEFEMGIGVA
jgi:hypothetical protein